MRRLFLFFSLAVLFPFSLNAQLGYWYHDKFISLSPDKSIDRKFVLARDSRSQENLKKMASTYAPEVIKKINDDRYDVRSDIIIDNNLYESKIYMSNIGKKVVVLPRIVVLLKEGYDINSILSAFNGKVILESSQHGRYVLSCNMKTSDEVLESILHLSRMDGLHYFEPEMYQNCELANTLYPNQYYLHNSMGVDINVEPIWNITNGSSNITVAVLDQGVEHGHEDLGGRVLSGYTIRNSSGFGEPQNDDSIDEKAHGTACAGIIAATNNSFGVRGIASNVSILPINIVPDYCSSSDINGFGTNLEIADAIIWAYSRSDIISCSCIFPESNDIEWAINEATYYGRNGKGCVFVNSSGNNSSITSVCFPASLSDVIAVGAIHQNGTVWNYSNRGNNLDLVAPSGMTDLLGDVVTTDRMAPKGYNTSGNYTDKFGGTSAACPQVAGVAALMLSVNPNLTQSEVHSILQTTATDLGTTGFDNTFGYGLVNASKAVVAAYGGFPGTYFNGNTRVDINYPTPLYVFPGTDANILSPLLIGATVSYSGNATPTIWAHNNTGGRLQVGMPSTGGNTILVQVNCIDGSTFYLPLVRINTPYLLSVIITERVMEVHLSKQDDRGDKFLNNTFNDADEDLIWTIEVYNTTTGEIIHNQKIEGISYYCDTTDWPSGIYIIRAHIGDEVLNEKIVIN